MEVEKSKRKTTSITQSCSPQPFWHRRLVSRKTISPWTRVGRDGLGMIQAYYNCCALYFCYISSTSGHQALDSGGWGPLVYNIECSFACDYLMIRFRSHNVNRKMTDVPVFLCISSQDRWLQLVSLPGKLTLIIWLRRYLPGFCPGSYVGR